MTTAHSEIDLTTLVGGAGQEAGADLAVLADGSFDRTILDSLPMGITVCRTVADPACGKARVVYQNPAARAMSAEDLDALVDRALGVLQVQPDGVDPLPPYQEMEVRLGSDGPAAEQRVFQLRCTPVPPAYVCVVFEEITRRCRMEAELRQAQRMEAFGQLAGGIAHDFNNMLTGIRGFSQLAAGMLDEDEPIRDDLEEVMAIADRAADLTRRLLVFGRKQVLDIGTVVLNDLIRGTERMLGRLLPETIRLELKLEETLPAALADPGQLEQVVINLALNARDAMPGGGVLTLQTTSIELDADYFSEGYIEGEPGHYALIAVSDTGHGIPPKVLEHIFEPFFTTKGEEEGTGLGLATAYGIIKQLGGHIQVYTEVGLGTTFKILLPADTACTVPEEPVDSPKPALDGSETVLLAEDNHTVRKIVRRVLQRAGYTILEAENPEEAMVLNRSYSGPIDLVLTDVVMPGSSGRELFEELGHQRPDTRVLYMSGYADAAIGQFGVASQSVDFIRKPFAPSGLLQKVREVLKRS